ncbi:TonB family protein [Cytophagales bacterium LB-30]|uniref:TonB family protein n=1 Tax=Shiella aurantiaca TaxID=3058365 RepID=A0ABT8F7T2_9BACT|nr:TonB family protein [Shiella aurantiaca]MDN4165996.1 TonB family protein [Shiella aurantiaca]
MKSRYIFKKKPLTVSDAEIQSYMDFDALLSPKVPVSGAKVSAWKLYVVSGLVAALTSVAVYWLMDKWNHTDTQEIPSEKVQAPQHPMMNSIPEEERKSSLIQDTNEEKGVIDKGQPKEKVETTLAQNKSNLVKETPPAKAEPETTALPQPRETQLIQAQPLVGIDSLTRYFDTQVQYPLSALKDSIEGQVIVQFTIEKDGRVTHPVVLQSLGEAFDQEALRVVSAMPQWQPARLNDRPLVSKASVPITFSIIRNSKGRDL